MKLITFLLTTLSAACCHAAMTLPPVPLNSHHPNHITNGDNNPFVFCVWYITSQYHDCYTDCLTEVVKQKRTTISTRSYINRLSIRSPTSVEDTTCITDHARNWFREYHMQCPEKHCSAADCPKIRLLLNLRPGGTRNLCVRPQPKFVSLAAAVKALALGIQSRHHCPKPSRKNKLMSEVV